jgi:hypothetical protein
MDLADSTRSQLDIVLVDLLGALRRGDTETAREALDTRVVWQGLRPEWRCEGAVDVVPALADGIAARHEIDSIEAIESGQRVLLSSRGPALDAIDDLPLYGEFHNVFTFHAGLVIRIEDARTRAEALQLAEMEPPPSWR